MNDGIQDLPRRGDMFIPCLRYVKVTKIFSQKDMEQYSPKLAQMGQISQINNGAEIRFLIWKKSVYQGASLLKLNTVYDLLEVYTNDKLGEISIQINYNSKVSKVKKTMDDYVDLGKIAYESGIEKKNYKPINVAVADSSLLKKPFTFSRVAE